MKRYLTAVDGSGGSERALSHAIARAREPRAEVHVVHVVPPVEYDELKDYDDRSDIVKIRREAHLRILASATDQVKAAGIPCAGHLLDGPPGETIARFAESQNIDEIIMGSHGRGAIGSALLGSVSAKVAHLARMPVTLVK
jgi:nucleotide-binding universal stress UspA family protein